MDCMSSRRVIVALGLLALVNGSLGLSCPSCNKGTNCGPTPSCSYGLTLGVCDCCYVCAKGVGESCGGPWDTYGTCSRGLECRDEICVDRNGCRDTRFPGLCVDFIGGGACSCSEVVSNGWCWDPNFASQAAECKLSCNHCFAAEGSCRPPWFRVGHQCFLQVLEKRTWTSARGYCSAQAQGQRGADLAQPRDVKALADAVLASGKVLPISAGGSGYWLGGSDLSHEGNWLWNRGSSIIGGWHQGEPNDGFGNEDCLSMVPELGRNSLGDADCAVTRRFICELKE